MSDQVMEAKEGVDQETVDAVQSLSGTYKHGWNTEIEMDFAPKGLTEDIVRLISERNEEPEWMLEWRLEAFARWQQMAEPDWSMLKYAPVDYQEQYYYAKPASMVEKPKSLDEVDPKLLETYEKLGIPLKEQLILAGVENAEEQAKDIDDDATGVVRSRWTRCSTPSLSALPSRRNWPRRASSSVRSRRRSASIPNWSGSTSHRSCRCRTTTSPR